MRVKCLAQEHNTMSLARVRTQPAQSGVERTNHEMLVSELSSLGLSPDQGHFVVFLSKTLYSHSASLHPGV